MQKANVLAHPGRYSVDYSFLYIFILVSPQQIVWRPPTSRKPICFIQSTDPNVHLSQKQAHLEIMVSHIPGYSVT